MKAQQWSSRLTSSIGVKWMVRIFTLLLGLIFVIKACYSIWHWEGTVMQMKEQIFADRWVLPLTISIAFGMATIGILLILGIFYVKSRLIGLFGTTALTAIFTLYSGLVLLHAFGFIPCACISWWDGIDWERSLKINLAMNLFSSTLLLTHMKERPPT